MKYDAFISYRHAPMDIAVSEQIHKRLENIRVPRSIRKLSGKKKIERVFRDQEELTVSSSLSEEILTALDESEYLIVICSPRTPESEWVENEVSYFIKTHGRERILPVIIEGEPKDSFPKPLLFEERREIDVRGETYVYETIAEPFAADYRAPDEKTRKQIIKRDILRLAAPILGCRYDDLKQRHREQRNRRIALGVTAFAVLAVVFGIYNYIQNQKILENYRKQQKTQSLFLADTSLRLLESGDRTNAILVALEALPKDLENPERPVLPQAEYALSKALHAYALGIEMVPDYTIEHQDVVSNNIQGAPSGLFFGSLDSRGVLNLHDIDTGESYLALHAETEEYPTDRIYDFAILKNDRVVAISGTGMTCINGLDGSMVWQVSYVTFVESFQSGLYTGAPYFTISGDESILGVRVVGTESCFLLDMADGRLLSSLVIDELDQMVTDIELSQDGSKLAVVYSDIFSQDAMAEVLVFDTTSGQQMTQISLAYSGAFFMDFSPDDLLACGSYDFSNWSDESGQIRMQMTLHDVVTGAELWASEVSAARSIMDLMISRVQLIYSEEAGDHILLVVENRVFVFDFETGVLVTEMISPSGITGSLLNPDTGLFLYTTDMGHVKWGDMYTGREYKDFDFLIQSDIMKMVGAANHMILVPYNSKSIMVYSYVEAPGIEPLLNFDSYSYTSMRLISPDGKYLLLGINYNDNTEAIVIDATSGEIVCRTVLPGMAKSAIFDDGGLYFAMVDATVLYYDFDTDSVESVYQNETSYITAYVNGAQTHFVFPSSGVVRMLSTESREITFEVETKDQFLAVSEDAKYLLMGGENGLFAINTEDSSHVEFEEHIELADGYNIRIAFSQSRNYAAIPASDQYIHVVDIERGKTISRISGVNSDIFSGYFMDDDATLVFHSNDYRIRAASVKTGELTYTGDDLINVISHWEYIEERKILAAVSSGEAILLNIEEGIYPAATVPDYLAFGQDAKYIYFANAYMLGRLPYRELKELYQLAEDVLGDRTLSQESRIKYYLDN